MNRSPFIIPERHVTYASRGVAPRRSASVQPVVVPGREYTQQVSTITRSSNPESCQDKKQDRRVWAALRVFFVRYGLSSVAILFIIIGSVLAILSFGNNMTVMEQVKAYKEEAQDSGEIHTGDGGGSVASSTRGGASAEAVSRDPALPAKIAIPAISVDAKVGVVGVNSRNQVGAPTNIDRAAWYNGSSSLRDKAGSSIIVGHKGNDRLTGVFHRIEKLQSGSEIQVTMGNGDVLSYSVEYVEVVDASSLDMGKYLSYLGNTNATLYLISCEGEYNHATHSYPKRAIVKAARVL